jgi:hypothetical protein
MTEPDGTLSIFVCQQSLLVCEPHFRKHTQWFSRFGVGFAFGTYFMVDAGPPILVVPAWRSGDHIVSP